MPRKAEVIRLGPDGSLINNDHGQAKISGLHINNIVASIAELFGDKDRDCQMDKSGQAHIQTKETSLTDLIHYVYGVDILGYKSWPTDISQISKLSVVLCYGNNRQAAIGLCSHGYSAMFII